MKSYTGPLHWKAFSKIERKAYASFNVQKANKEKMEYDVREYMGWYVQEYKKLGASGTAIVWRKDDSKPYSLDNVVMRKDNIREGYMGAQHELTPKWLRFANFVFRNAKNRCSNKNTNSYEFYGKKGIRFELEWLSFKEWYKKELGNRDPKGLTLGRIDHSKNYTLDNIELQTRSDNSKERIQRLGSPGQKNKQPILLLDPKNQTKVLKRYSSITEAVNDLGVGYETIIRATRGRAKRSRLFMKFEEK
jgi:hypothetical protein